MGLISDLATTVVRALQTAQFVKKQLGKLTEEEMDVVIKSFDSAVSRVIVGASPAASVILVAHRDDILSHAVDFIRNPLDFTEAVIADWSRMLNDALAQLNVDANPNLSADDLADPEIIASNLRVQTAAAQLRVAGALTVINGIVAIGNAISIAAEIGSAGMVRSIAEAVQSFVWANGISNFASLAYQPQINASLTPWLNRFYNKEARAQVPGPGDQIRFQLREVYLLDRRRELLAGPPRAIFNENMAQLGFSEFDADSYWAAHWFLPSITQLNEMLFRNVIDEDRWTQFVQFNDFDPSSVPNLKEIIFNPYTRVDVRRMADLGVLSEQELLQAYADLGFFAPTGVDSSGKLRAQFVGSPDFTVHKAQGLVLFTKLFNALPDLRARFRNGWLSSTELLQEFIGLGIPAENARIQWETIVKQEKDARTAPEKELTRALVVRGWKLRLISFTQGSFLLQRMGYDEAEAALILRVQSEPDDPLAFVATNLGARLTGGAITGITSRAFEEDV